MELLVCFWEFMMLIGFVLLLGIQDITAGQELGPRYKTHHPKVCSSDLDCDVNVGETCWILFTGCRKGQCMCDPRAQFKDDRGECRNVKLGGDECGSLDRCPEGMSCQQGICACEDDTATMTEDKRFCKKQRVRFLGEQCNPIQHDCYQRLGFSYKQSEVYCKPDEGRCRCESGFKEDRGACVKWNIGEYGCTRAHHCHGGAVCMDNSCQCPSGYESVADNSKCARIGSISGLDKGDYCNEIGERRYCSSGLICHQCAGEISFKCARYLESQQWHHVSHSNSVHPLPGMGQFIVVILAVVSTVLSVLHCCHL